MRNLTTRHCEDWMTKRGQAVAAQSYKHERRTLIAILDYAIREGLIIENVAWETRTPAGRGDTIAGSDVRTGNQGGLRLWAP